MMMLMVLRSARSSASLKVGVYPHQCDQGTDLSAQFDLAIIVAEIDKS